MADFKEHLFEGKMSVCQIPLQGAPGVVMLKSPGAAHHLEILFSLTWVVVYAHFIPLCAGLWLRKIYGY